MTDYEATVDDDGYVALVLSDPADKPNNASNWLPWGGAYYNGTIIYRHMLADPSFPQAVQNIPEFTPTQATMQEYTPVARYCPKAAFEAGGWAACA